MQNFQVKQLEKKYKGNHVRLFTSPKHFQEGIFVGSWSDYCVVMTFCDGKTEMRYIKSQDLILIIPVARYSALSPNNIFRCFYRNFN